MICENCVGPAPLKKVVSQTGRVATCGYCGHAGTCVDPPSLYTYIFDRIEENTASEEDLSSYEDAMIFDVKADITEVASVDVVLTEWMGVEDEPYFDDMYGAVPDVLTMNRRGQTRLFFRDEGNLEKNFYEERWAQFVEAIRHSHRFFNPLAAGFLDSVFSFLVRDGRVLKPECVRVLRKGEFLYRARSVATYEDAKRISEDPGTLLGPTPKDRASSQRMTPNGISALYGALERETCLSEIRSITGDKVVSAAFTPVKEVALLDLTRFKTIEPPPLSMLDKGRRDSKHLKTFVDSLVQKMSTPRGRNDELSYLSTQVVFEYLRLTFGEQVFGLVFPSVQTGEKGTNVVLFPECSVVSKKTWNRPRFPYSNEYPEFTPLEGKPIEDSAVLSSVSGSVRFHSVRAIETRADEHGHVSELFMSPLQRRRLGL